MAQRLIAGNWKMNGTSASLFELDALKAGLEKGAEADVLVCPPATLIARAVKHLSGSAIAVGAQDCHTETSGAHTGDISATMLADAGASHVILGHSERRTDHSESDAFIWDKIEAAIAAGLTPVICVGETEVQRDAAQTNEVIARQISDSIPSEIGDTPLIVAYEPVWAIGTGRTPSFEDIADIHGAIRGLLVGRFGATGEQARILYGGSVKPDNAAPILKLDNVDGALVGGASLKAEDFLAIIAAA